MKRWNVKGEVKESQEKLHKSRGGTLLYEAIIRPPMTLLQHDHLQVLYARLHQLRPPSQSVLSHSTSSILPASEQQSCFPVHNLDQVFE
jgi:hypothetical protein